MRDKDTILLEDLYNDVSNEKYVIQSRFRGDDKFNFRAETKHIQKINDLLKDIQGKDARLKVYHDNDYFICHVENGQIVKRIFVNKEEDKEV
jgi:hypothetical protein